VRKITSKGTKRKSSDVCHTIFPLKDALLAGKETPQGTRVCWGKTPSGKQKKVVKRIRSSQKDRGTHPKGPVRKKERKEKNAVLTGNRTSEREKKPPGEF